MTFITIYADEDVNVAIVEGLKRRGIDAYSCKDFRNFGLGDEEQIEFAKRNNFVLLIHDADFLRVIQEKKLSHNGILFVPQTAAIGLVIRKIEYLTSFLSTEDMVNHVEFL